MSWHVPEALLSPMQVNSYRWKPCWVPDTTTWSRRRTGFTPACCPTTWKVWRYTCLREISQNTHAPRISSNYAYCNVIAQFEHQMSQSAHPSYKSKLIRTHAKFCSIEIFLFRSHVKQRACWVWGPGRYTLSPRDSFSPNNDSGNDAASHSRKEKDVSSVLSPGQDGLAGRSDEHDTLLRPSRYRKRGDQIHQASV